MSEPRTTSPHRNEVVVSGRLSVAPVERVLPSGDEVVTWRLVVDRPERASRPGIDVIDCAAFGARVRRTVMRWTPGDIVEVQGALRRRFWKGDTGTASRYEVDVSRAAAVR